MQSIVAIMQGETNLDWDDVKLFLGLYRSRSLGEAAGRLGIDGSTASRRLTTLESSLNTVLFERSRDGIAATDSAEALLSSAEEMELAVARFSGAVDTLEREIEGTVRIACPPDVAEMVVLPDLSKLKRRHPGLDFVIEPGEGLADIAKRNVDIALRTVRPEQGDLVVKKLLTMSWAVAASPGLQKKLGRLCSWKGLTWIGWGARFAQAAPARWLGENVERPDVVLRTDSLGLQIAAVRRGLGVALLPSPSIHHYGLHTVQLSAALRKATHFPEDNLYMVTHQAIRRVPRIKAVWEFLEQSADKHIPLR